MKNIYLLLECSGEYEDYIKCPLKAFLSLERAKEAQEEYKHKKRSKMRTV